MRAVFKVMVFSEQGFHLVAKTANLVSVAEAQQHRIAVSSEPNARREAYPRIIAELPRDGWGEIMCCLVQAEPLPSAQPTVEFNSRGKVFPAEPPGRA